MHTSADTELVARLLEYVPAMTAADFVIAYRFKSVLALGIEFITSNILEHAAKAIDLHKKESRSIKLHSLFCSSKIGPRWCRE